MPVSVPADDEPQYSLLERDVELGAQVCSRKGNIRNSLLKQDVEFGIQK